jgi:hypothetical protein
MAVSKGRENSASLFCRAVNGSGPGVKVFGRISASSLLFLLVDISSAISRATDDAPRSFWRELLHFDRSKLKIVLIFLSLALLITQLSYLGSLNPWLYVRGLMQVNANHAPSYMNYLHGEFKTGGSWNYFLVAFLVKATCPFLILIFIRFAFLLANWKMDWWPSMFLVVPSIVYSSVGIGRRFGDPVYIAHISYDDGIFERDLEVSKKEGRFWLRLGIVGMACSIIPGLFPIFTFLLQ